MAATANDLGTGWMIYIISVRHPSTDFRRDMASALRTIGACVTYARLGHRCFVDDGSAGDGVFVSPAALLKTVWRSSQERTCVLLSVNTGFPWFSMLLRICAPRALWLFDEHDDLLYTSSGLRRIGERLKLFYFRLLTSRSICVSPNLLRRVRRGILVANGSSVQRRFRKSLDTRRVLVLSNVDERFDFDFIEAFHESDPDIVIDIYGGRRDDSVTRNRWSSLLSRPGINYCDAYRNADVQAILDRYSIMIVPYKVDRSTFYIDPLRYYHGLNNGLELISTKIPRALDFSDRLHLVRDGKDAARVVHALRDGQTSRKNEADHPHLSWECRAREMMRAIADTPSS